MTMIKLGKGGLDAIYPIGSIIITSSNINPSNNFGGSWELLKTITGGELIAYGWAYNGSSNSVKVAQNADIIFSDSIVPNKQSSITDFVGNVLGFHSGTFRVNTRNIVGIVEATITVSGVFEDDGALWFRGNANDLPNGVIIHSGDDGPILGNSNAMYSGASRTYFYKIDDSITNNLSFYINPIARAYNSAFIPCSGGVKSELLVKVYARKQLNYLWERVA